MSPRFHTRSPYPSERLPSVVGSSRGVQDGSLDSSSSDRLFWLLDTSAVKIESLWPERAFGLMGMAAFDNKVLMAASNRARCF